MIQISLTRKILTQHDMELLEHGTKPGTQDAGTKILVSKIEWIREVKADVTDLKLI